MRNYLIVLFSALILSACSYSYHPHRNSLTNIPILGSGEDIELFFGDELPSEPYIKVSMVHDYTKPNESYNSLVDGLKRSASYYGCDAVIQIRQGSSKESHITLLELLAGEEAEEYTAKTLTGVGIKYVRNLKYLSRFPKSKEVLKIGIDTSYHELIVKVDFDFFGKQKATHTNSEAYKDFYFDSLKKTSLDYLQNDKSDWKYHSDEMQRVTLRKRRIDGQLKEKVRFYYEGNSHSPVKIVGYEAPGFTKKAFQLKLTYHEDGVLHKVKVFRKKGEKWEGTPTRIDEYYWDEKRSKLESITHSFANGDTYKTVYHYYSNKDINERLITNPKKM